ncbi:LysR family transcriptional regulator [Acidisoma cellulosilytica]|uniref:LysR family transcriptional regulator n=1 Tax=Acidisoma cellulosilyticum TaxID=2802395 RepID=A0A963Z3B1_9PROT|nr:LysR family transcriptional regulator [Acidisoma cellulosilyticum]MCB8881120.1 LysR family transcriptional regulator [Acidisoma cellulosilyticum]
MELHQLRYFTVIATEGSFSRASALLGVSQSALTRQIQLLEEEAGSRLLHRNGHGVTLTMAGAKFLASTEKVLSGAEHALLEVQAMSATPSGKVVLGIPPMLGEHLLVPLVRRFREDYPEAKLQIREGISGYVMDWLMSGQVDVAIVYNAPRRATLNVETLVTDQLLLVGATQGKTRLGDPIRFADAVRMPLILPSGHHGLRYIVDQAARDAKLEPNVVIEVDGFAAINKLVAAGLGMTLLPYPFASAGLARGEVTMSPIIEPSLIGVFSIGMTTHRPVTAAMRALYNALRNEMRQLLTDGGWKSGRDVFPADTDKVAQA